MLFDLGVRKDWETEFAPRIRDRITGGGWKVTVEKNVREILESNGVKGEEIDAIVWSHWHWDHTGAPAEFEKKTDLVVGPGFKKNFMPAYPTKKDSPLLDSDFDGRKVVEIAFDQGLKIGHFEAFDYFGDGSFYLLDSPGHAIGHLCGLARVTADSFIFMGGDACHHGGEFRPSQWMPLPKEITPHPFNDRDIACPGSMFDHLLRDGDNSQSFYDIPDLGEKGISYDRDEALRTITKVQEADANEKILVVIAHDPSLLDVVDFFPKYANDFAEKGWARKGRWAFLKDFQEAAEDKDYRRGKRSDEE